MDNSKGDLRELNSAFAKAGIADLCRPCASYKEAEAALNGNGGPVAIVADLDMGEGHKDGARWLLKAVRRVRRVGGGCWGILASHVDDENELLEAAESGDDFRIIPVSKKDPTEPWSKRCADYVRSMFGPVNSAASLGPIDPTQPAKDRLFWYSTAMNDAVLESMGLGDLFLMPRDIQEAGAKHGKSRARPVLMYRGAFYHLGGR
jgi:hypothetical protein